MFSVFSKVSRLREAVLWRVKAEEAPDLVRSKEFRSWEGVDANREAFSDIGHVWNALDEQRDSPELLALRQAALRRAHAGKISRNSKRISYGLWAAATAAAVVVGFMTIQNLSEANRPITYATGVGERRTVVLADGSRVALDASSTVTVEHRSMRVRNLTLTKGRARFDVAHNNERPFTVSAGSEATTALGTSFDVERLNSKIFVTLRTGRVVVKAIPEESHQHDPFILVPGDELIARRGGRPLVQKVNLGVAGAWENGKIVLTDQILSDAIEQFNRYLDKPISVDPAVANMRISGVFKLEDAKSFVSALTNYLPINAQVNENGEIFLEKRV